MLPCAATGRSAGASVSAYSTKFGRGADLDYFYAVGQGHIVGHRRVTALGHNPDVDSGPEDMWDGGGLYPWMSAATALEVVSSSANDTAAGTGARTIVVAGLDASWNEVTKAVILNGTTPVAIAAPNLYRVQLMSITSAGSGRVNAGDITLRDAGAGTTRGVISAGYGISRQAQYTVPLGYFLNVLSVFACINRPSSTRDGTIATFVQSPAGFYRMPFEISVAPTPYRHDFVPPVPLTLPEKTDFGLRCNYVSATNTDITAAWMGVLVKDTKR